MISRSVMRMVLPGATRTGSPPTVRNRRVVSAKKNESARVLRPQLLLGSVTEVLEQKGTGVAPQAVGGPGRNVQSSSRLFPGEAREEPELDQPGRRFVAA